MPDQSYDVLIIGAGNGGMGVTVPTRKAGLSVAIVEEAELGGTCPNRGCTPKKILVAAARAMQEIAQAGKHCIKVDAPKLDWAGLIDREQAMIAHLPQSFADTLTKRGVTVLRGHAAFVAPNQVRVADHRIEARNIVIATGSKPRPLPIAGSQHMVTSDEVLSDRQLPREVVFIGGGVIAMEFSHVYARAGAKVTILEAQPTLLGNMDADAVAKIREESERIGIRMRTDVKVKAIAEADGRLRVVYEDEGSEQTLDVDRVVNGAGRVPNVDKLDLQAANVSHDKGRISVNKHLRSTSNPAVWVAGDPLASPQLSPVATYEGRIVGRNIVEGPKHSPDYASIPACVYTVPALATVGLTEAAAKEKGLKVKVEVNDMSDWMSSRTYAETAAWAKILIEETSDRIAGAHIVGHAGEELINIFALAMAHGITASQLHEMIYAFPTLSNDIKHMF